MAVLSWRFLAFLAFINYGRLRFLWWATTHPFPLQNITFLNLWASCLVPSVPSDWQPYIFSGCGILHAVADWITTFIIKRKVDIYFVLWLMNECIPRLHGAVPKWCSYIFWTMKFWIKLRSEKMQLMQCSQGPADQEFIYSLHPKYMNWDSTQSSRIYTNYGCVFQLKNPFTL